MDTYDKTIGADNLAGEYVEPHKRMAEEEARKTAYFNRFHIGHEGFHENHGHDRNKTGS